jgi:hypothetical protein
VIGYRFPSEIIQQAIWLYLRFTLSIRLRPPRPATHGKFGCITWTSTPRRTRVSSFVGDADLAEGRLLQRKFNDPRRDLGRGPVRQDRLHRGRPDAPPIDSRSGQRRRYPHRLSRRRRAQRPVGGARRGRVPCCACCDSPSRPTARSSRLITGIFQIHYCGAPLTNARCLHPSIERRRPWAGTT